MVKRRAAEVAAPAQKEIRANKIAGLVITLVDGQDTARGQGFGFANRTWSVSAGLLRLEGFCESMIVFSPAAPESPGAEQEKRIPEAKVLCRGLCRNLPNQGSVEFFVVTSLLILFDSCL
ncbi:MAG: hypothetical protein E4H36_09965 [Spirochaetales bacterium]|nr:MAG: hypothetical protein E4H36_09965 [Spirochaetales bacterium]